MPVFGLHFVWWCVYGRKAWSSPTGVITILVSMRISPNHIHLKCASTWRMKHSLLSLQTLSSISDLQPSQKWGQVTFWSFLLHTSSICWLCSVLTFTLLPGKHTAMWFSQVLKRSYNFDTTVAGRRGVGGRGSMPTIAPTKMIMEQD